MKLPIFDQNRKKVGEKELPLQFQEEFRPDLIKRAVCALWSAQRQPYGATPEAGLRHSSTVSKERKHYRGCYGFGISRINRKVLSRRGTRMFWVGAFSPQARGGHPAHPPKAEKLWAQKINQKEKRKALRSAISATLDKKIVEKRGHQLPSEYPFLIDSSLEKLSKTQELKQILLNLGFEKDLQRGEVKKVRAGVGKTRGRRYHQKKSLLIIVGEKCSLLYAGKNIPGVEIVEVKAINTELLAPGAAPGRATLWTTNAVESLEKNKLFV